MKARYYDNLTGRFLSNDPVGFQDDNAAMFNRYSYGENNPYKYVDPDGRYASDYTAENEKDYIKSELDRLLESGGARSVLASNFFLDDSREHFKNGNGIPVVVSGDVPVHKRLFKGPYGADCESKGVCMQEVGTRGLHFTSHGRLTINIINGDAVSIDSESYDFENDEDASTARNVNTAAGKIIHGPGQEYMIHYRNPPNLRPTLVESIKELR